MLEVTAGVALVCLLGWVAYDLHVARARFRESLKACDKTLAKMREEAHNKLKLREGTQTADEERL